MLCIKPSILILQLYNWQFRLKIVPEHIINLSIFDFVFFAISVAALPINILVSLNFINSDLMPINYIKPTKSGNPIVIEFCIMVY